MKSIVCGQRVRLTLHARGKGVPVIAVRHSLSYRSHLALVTTEAGFQSLFSPLPPYEDTRHLSEENGGRFKTYYMLIQGEVPPEWEREPDEDPEPQVVEVHVDFPREPDLKCHDCGGLFYKDQVKTIRLHNFWQTDKPYTEDALRLGLTDDDVPPGADPMHYTFYVCKRKCLKEREALDVLAGEEAS